MNEEELIQTQKMKWINRKESGRKLYVNFYLFDNNRTVVVEREHINDKSTITFRINKIKLWEKIWLIEYMVLKKTRDWYKRNNKKYNFFTIN